jgi:hypothetical protein
MARRSELGRQYAGLEEAEALVGTRKRKRGESDESDLSVEQEEGDSMDIDEVEEVFI